jgi:putative transcriptional regulator
MERDIFSELMDGTEALADERQGRVTLRTHKINLPKRVPVTAEEVVSIRQQLDPSRAQMRKL